MRGKVGKQKAPIPENGGGISDDGWKTEGSRSVDVWNGELCWNILERARRFMTQEARLSAIAVMIIQKSKGNEISGSCANNSCSEN